MLGVLLPFAPAVPEPFYSALLPPLSTFSLFSFFLFFLSHLLSHSSSLLPPSLLPLLLFQFFLSPPSLPPSPSSFSTLPPSAPPGPSPSTPSLLHPSFSSFKPQPVPCSCLLVPLTSAPHPSVLHAWGPCPPHSWGAGSAPACPCAAALGTFWRVGAVNWVPSGSTSDPVPLSPQKVEEVGAWALGGGRASPSPISPSSSPLPMGHPLPFTPVRGGWGHHPPSQRAKY